MITDLFLSFHKLIMAGKKVKWHWLPLLAAWYIFLIILYNWWDLISIEDITEWMNILFFIAYGHLLLLIYLAVSTVLPDVAEKKEVDLRNYYFENHRYFWGLMTAVVLLSISIGFFKGIENIRYFNAFNLCYTCIFIALMLILIRTKKYWVHSALLVIFVAQTLLQIIFK